MVNFCCCEVSGFEEFFVLFNLVEKCFYVFVEKFCNVFVGGNFNFVFINFCMVICLDLMMYMFFGVYEFVVIVCGFECDGWLFVMGNIYVFDDV